MYINLYNKVLTISKTFHILPSHLVLLHTPSMKTYQIDLIDDFLFEKSVNQWLSKYTIKDYQQVFTMLLQSDTIDIHQPSTFTPSLFKRWLWTLLVERNWKSTTYNRNRKNLKVFCDYLVSIGYITENPLIDIPNRREAKQLPRYLDRSQVSHLQRVIQSTYNHDTYISSRNKTILYFYMHTWLRLYELINLDISDIKFLDNHCLIRSWKWKKDRLVPLSNELKQYLIDYYYYRSKYKITNTALFITCYGSTMQHREVYNLLKKINTKLNFHVTPHMLRHTFASNMIQKWLDIYSVSRVLWHNSLKTTEIYLHTTVDNITSKMNEISLYA